MSGYVSNAPINVKPYSPPFGHRWGEGGAKGGFCQKNTPHGRGFWKVVGRMRRTSTWKELEENNVSH